MLVLALKAKIPIIAARTSDTMNFPDIVEHLLKRPITMLDPALTVAQKRLYVSHGWPKAAQVPVKLYEKLVNAQSSLVVLNPKEIVEPMFDAGEVPVPAGMVVSFLKDLTDDLDRAKQLARTLGGCTLKEAHELARLTMARDHSLTSHGLVESRKTAFLGQKGLMPIDPHQPLYVPPAELVAWCERERAFFLSDDIDPRLVPRGLLFGGTPGTGKSAGAKWLSTMFGVPLYRLDIGTTKGKYVGDSEGALAANLARIDREQPCIVLIDEIEKAFTREGAHDGDTTSSMLGQLLWWLAEHRSRVLTVMTTNDHTKLPPELYREGRIDEVMMFEGLTFNEATSFVAQVLGTFSDKQWPPQVLHQIVMSTWKHHDPGLALPRLSHAVMTKAAYTFVKQNNH